MNKLKQILKSTAFSLVILFVAQSNQAQSLRTFDIHFENGQYMQIQACAKGIFHFRIQSTSEFSESLMDRYSILKSDWKASEPQSKTEKGNQIIQTNDYQIIIDQRTGQITVKDIIGNTIIERIAFSDTNNPICDELGLYLNKYFGNAKAEGIVIGDTKATSQQAEYVEVGNLKLNSVLDISLKSEERFYGGGSTSRRNIQHRGEALRMWSTYQKTEIPMPFLISSNGWGIFNNTTSRNYFDVGRFQKDKLFIYNTNGNMDFYLMLGNSMADVINLYTTITGKPYVLPKWAYGLAFGGNMMEDQFDIMNDAIRFRDEKIPCDLFWLEPQWMSKNYDFSTSQNWNLDKFPAEPYWEIDNFPKHEAKTLFISKLHGLGFKLALWLCINVDLSIEEEDHLAEKTGKKQSGLEHWFPHLTRFLDQGVDGFKVDPSRTINEHPDRKYYNGYTDKEMHNLNQVLLPKQLNETFREHKGIRSFQHYCGGYTGTQHWGASTSGDSGGGRDALFDQLNLGLSGFVNTSADVMEVDDTKAGIHFGFFLPWVQINSWYSLHHPWYLPPIEKEAFCYYAQLRNSLSPYIYSAALEGSQTGMPILRAMPLIFSDDRKVDNMTNQFMFGENLLVSAFSDSIYLPKGTWINFWTNERFTGGKTIHCKVPDNRGGLLFIKGGAIIPFQLTMQYIGEHPVDTLIIKVYPEKQSTYTLLEDDGKTFNYEKGSIASTKFFCNRNNGNIEFLIEPVKGSYKAIPDRRTYALEIDSPSKPQQIKVNGQSFSDWIYSDGKILLTVSGKISEWGRIIIAL